jgi:hypothetical protein
MLDVFAFVAFTYFYAFSPHLFIYFDPITRPSSLTNTVLLNSVADPWHFGTDQDLDPAIFVNDLQDGKSFFAYYFLKLHLHH